MSIIRVSLVGACLLLSLGYLACFHYTENYQVSAVWNRVSGDLYLDATNGFHFSAPWVSVSRIDTRPQRLCLMSGGRGYSCKLVQFDPVGFEVFAKNEGFRYYWWSNRISLNTGHAEEYRGMRDILRGYAYSGTTQPFLRVLNEYQQ